MNRPVVGINVLMDRDGKWIAFGRSDNAAAENAAVNIMLAAKFLAGGPSDWIETVISMPAGAEVEHVG